MENLKHTKGEWKIGKSEIFRPASSVSISPYYKQICSFVDNGTDECKANAKLIAAAPDMLDALIKAKETISKLLSFSEFPHEDRKQYYNFITNAINKATK